VNRNGVLTGKHHFPGQGVMQKLLEEEGLEIENDQIKDFKKHFWQPPINEGFKR
jgi:methylated-DNA-protein-cysteine methyltransferase-like protein